MNGATKQRIIFGLAVALTLICVSSGAALAANKLIVKGTDGTTDKFVVTDSGFIGVGTSNPNMPLYVVGNGNSSLTSLFFHNQGVETGYTAYDAPGLNFFRNNHSTVNNGLPRNGDRLGYFSFGSEVAGVKKYLTQVSSFAEGTWSETVTPTNLIIYTTSQGTNAPTEKLRVTADGGIKLSNNSNKPACNSSTRGTLWFTKAAVGVADTFEVCAKNSDENYSWKPLF